MAIFTTAAAHAATVEYPENYVPRAPSDFTLYSTDHFEVYYDPSSLENLSIVLSAAENAYNTTSAFFGPYPYRTTIIVADSHDQYAALLNDPSLPEPSLASGWGYGNTGTIAILAPDQIPNFQTVLTHEMTHIAVREYLPGNRYDLPDWFFEGLSVYISGGLNPAVRGVIEEDSREGSVMSIPTLEELHEQSTDPDTNMTQLSHAYTESGMLVEFIADTYGNDTLKRILKDFGETDDLDVAFEDSFGLTQDSLLTEWDTDLKHELDIRDGIILDEQVSGYVTDQKGRPMADQNVTITSLRNDSPAYGREYNATTNASGYYRVNVTYGPLDVHAEKLNYDTVDLNVTLQRDQVLRMDLLLNDSAFEQKQAAESADALEHDIIYVVLATLAITASAFIYWRSRK